MNVGIMNNKYFMSSEGYVYGSYYRKLCTYPTYMLIIYDNNIPRKYYIFLPILLEVCKVRLFVSLVQSTLGPVKNVHIQHHWHQ